MRCRVAGLALMVALGAVCLPAQAKPGASLKAYQAFAAKALKLKPSGTQHVEGGASSDWYYRFKGKSKRGLPLELTVQVGGDKIYSQALTVTTVAGRQADVDEVAALAERFWAEATDGHGRDMSKTIAPVIAAGQAVGEARYRQVTASLTKMAAGNQILFVVGAELRSGR